VEVGSNSKSGENEAGRKGDSTIPNRRAAREDAALYTRGGGGKTKRLSLLTEKVRGILEKRQSAPKGTSEHQHGRKEKNQHLKAGGRDCTHSPRKNEREVKKQILNAKKGTKPKRRGAKVDASAPGDPKNEKLVGETAPNRSRSTANHGKKMDQRACHFNLTKGRTKVNSSKESWRLPQKTRNPREGRGGKGTQRYWGAKISK